VPVGQGLWDDHGPCGKARDQVPYQVVSFVRGKPPQDWEVERPHVFLLLQVGVERVHLAQLGKGLGGKFGVASSVFFHNRGRLVVGVVGVVPCAMGPVHAQCFCADTEGRRREASSDKKWLLEFPPPEAGFSQFL